MAIAEDDRRLSFFKQPYTKQGAVCFTDHWWAEHPDKGLLVWDRVSPQCTTSEAVARLVIGKLYPWANIRFVETAYILIDQRELEREF